MDADLVHFTKERETSLITLYGRALDSRSKNPILRDEAAEKAIRQIDYDFRKLKVRKSSVSYAIRAKRLDAWTAEFLADNPDATVLHLGCGLDSRVDRIDPPASVRWYDLDYAEVIALRRRLYPERDGYCTIGSSVTDPGWLDKVPADSPVMIVAEGLLPYLAKHDTKTLLERLTDHFPSGQLAFDACSPLTLRLVRYHPSLRATGASLGGWGIDDPRELEKWNPRLQLITELTLTDTPEIAKLPRRYRGLCRVVNGIPALRRMLRLLRYRF